MFVTQAEVEDRAPRALYVAHVEALGGWRSAVEAGGRTVNALFLATEETPSPVDVEALADYMIKSGLFWLSSWRPGCEAVHDTFDAIDVHLHESEERYPVVMTTWHDHESLDEALWFFWNAAFPDEGKEGGPTFLALSVGSDVIKSDLEAAAAAL
jgi:hypothetical protein